jgi:hypothetical protein
MRGETEMRDLVSKNGRLMEHPGQKGDLGVLGRFLSQKHVSFIFDS